ncbi:hypothetical protein LXL04_025074 [Taraxacum kok-saghyz]
MVYIMHGHQSRPLQDFIRIWSPRYLVNGVGWEMSSGFRRLYKYGIEEHGYLVILAIHDIKGFWGYRLLIYATTRILVGDRLQEYINGDGGMDGKDYVAKTITQEFDEAKKLVTFKILEGDLVELYKSFVVHIHVDTDGLNNVVTCDRCRCINQKYQLFLRR